MGTSLPGGATGGRLASLLPGNGEARWAPQRPDGGARGLGPESESMESWHELLEDLRALGSRISGWLAC